MLQQETLLNNRLVYLNEIGARSSIAQSILLLFMLILMILLPFLKITISVKGKGITQSEMARTDVIVPVSGQLIKLNFTDNQKINIGETLLIIDSTFPKQQSELLIAQKSHLLNQLLDAEKLAGALDDVIRKDPVGLRTTIYMASWQLYKAQLKQAEDFKRQAKLTFERYERLYIKKVISQVEFEQYKFSYEQAVLSQRMIDKRFRSLWLIESNKYRNELQNLAREKNLLAEQQKRYALKATVAGSIQNLIGIQNGTYVSTNQKLAEISPDDRIIAVCYVKSSDIAFIKKGQVVRLQIDAFQHHQGGALKGKVFDISADVVVQNHVSYFKIKCQFDKQNLLLKNVKKGMTLLASFAIARKSLYQLLLDKHRDLL